MLLHSSTPRLRALEGGLLAAAILFPASAGLAQMGPFDSLQGTWVGNGTIATADGRNEPIRCRAKYFLSPSGRSLDQVLRCASDTYRFDVNSGLVRDATGSISGTWTETTRNASGSVRGREEGDSIVATIDGPNFTADMNVTIHEDEQSVQILPAGGDIKSVTVELHQE
jgi:hypothetical protein